MNAQLIEQLDVPEDATYDGYPITEIEYNHDLSRLCVIYEGSSLYEGWDQLVFTECDRENGRITLSPSGIPIGLVDPEPATDRDTPGANEAAEMYRVLTEAGINVRGYQ